MSLSLFDRVSELLFPTKCVFCHKLTGDPRRTLCDKCVKSLPYIPKAVQGQRLPHIRLSVAPLYYEGSVRTSLHRFKFSGLSFYDKTYSEFIANCVKDNGIVCDAVTWVPVSKRRKHRRGYDQARLLAEKTAAHLNVPCECTLIKKIDNRPQSLAGSPEQRRANVKGVYGAAASERIKGKSLLLIDDIITTGATVSECAGVLKSAGAEKVFAAALARRR